MNRLTIVSLASVLTAAPLLAQSRIISAAGPAPTEKVNWTAGVPYTYDGSGNVRQIDKDKFVYDKAGRLVQAQINGITRVYTYDAFGNRTGCTHQPGTTDLSDCQLGLTIDSSSNRVNGVAYDGVGNVRSYYGHTYTYDDVNMPVRDDRGGGLAREFVYTADDERIAVHTVGSSWNWTIREVGGKVLREFTSDAQGNFAWARDYVYRDGLLLASVQRSGTGTATDHYHLDHLGTPRRVTNQNNRTVGFHDYYAFGPEVSGGLTEPMATTLQYTGHERDKWGAGEGPDTLDYMHARYNSPTLGRFLSIDPVTADLRTPQSWNRYAYALNNPISNSDPTGLYTIHCGDLGEDDCNAERDRFEKARKDQLKSSDATLRDAAAAYGDPGKDNGVFVSFIKGKDAENFNADVTARIQDQATARYDVRFKMGMDVADLKNAVVHEGEHIRSAQAFVAALQRGVYEPSLNLTLYQTEVNAYMITWAFARTNNSVIKYNGMVIKGMMLEGPFRQELDRFLRRAPYNLTPERKKCQFMPCDW
jgi:RHS repeat-associated protein